MFFLLAVLFSVYLNGLLQKLADSGVGCHWGHLFANAVCYADDIVLLAPCQFALRNLQNICSSYASTHGLRFNADKTWLIFSHLCQSHPTIPVVCFNNIVLHYFDEVIHLGHILISNMNDRCDIIRTVNSLFCTFMQPIHL